MSSMTSSPKLSPLPTLPPRSSPKSLPTSRSSPCCDTGRPIAIDPVSGQTVCSCQYNPASAAALAAAAGVYNTPGLPRLPPHLSEALYSQAMAVQSMVPGAGLDPAALYSGLGSPYDFKALPPAVGLFNPYDPTLGPYPFANSFLDPNARRKNATRESTQTLKAWLSEHKKNPYPTKGEKIMLAIITKMTLTQVSTWFANARRRLKKENKMTWEPRNRMDDDDDDAGSDVDIDVKEGDEDGDVSIDSDNDEPTPFSARDLLHPITSTHTSSDTRLSPHAMSMVNNSAEKTSLVKCDDEEDSCDVIGDDDSDNHTEGESPAKSNSAPAAGVPRTTPKASDESRDPLPLISERPKHKIWSMAEIATSSQHQRADDASSPRGTSSSPSLSPRSRSENEPVPQLPPHLNKLPTCFPFPPGLHPAWRSAAATHPYFHPQFFAAHRSFANSLNARNLAHVGAFGAFSMRPELANRDGVSMVPRHPSVATNPLSVNTSLGLN